jgi:putative N6-adenine-specific DNA methylase
MIPVLFPITVTTFYGLEGVLARELTDLGGVDVEVQHLAVTCRGDKAFLYRANYWLRTGLRVLRPLYTFRARGDQDLYHRVQEIHWADYLTVKNTLAVDSTVSSPYFRHSQYAALRVKDAVVDQFRDATGERPSVDVELPDLRLNLYINDDLCTLSLDSSGESLHRRGYRASLGPAQLNEVLAAGLVRLSGWDGKTNFVDPMCGSGTLVVEAALIAGNMAPGKFRTRFGFVSWKDYDEKLFDGIRAAAAAAETPADPGCRMVGADISAREVHAAVKNAEGAGLKGRVRFSGTEFQKTIPPEGGGTAIINPPYGERMGGADLTGLYKSIGDALKQKYQGYEAWIISSNKDALKNVGLRPSRKVTVHNGGLECKFQRYSMYGGSVKQKKKEGETDVPPEPENRA